MQLIDNLPDNLADCRYCSQVSKAKGVDPIGSAPKVDYWILVEVAQPWPLAMFAENPMIGQMFSLVKQLVFRRGVMVRPIAIAPDPEYSTPGFTRIIYYRRPAQQFAKYLKEEYVVPEDQANALVLGLLNRLLGKENTVTPFLSYQQDTQHLREMLVCTHTQVDLACGRFGTPIYRQLRQQSDQSNLRIWQSTHFGGHQFAPTLIDLPTGQFWGHLELEDLPQLIQRNGDYRQLKQLYRGWSGGTKFEQIAERAVWMEIGWDWLTYPKKARTYQKKLIGIQRLLYPLLRYIPIKLLQLWLDRWTRNATGAKVEMVYKNRHHTQERYQVTIAEAGKLITATNSVKTPKDSIETSEAQQYQITQLKKID